jgi:hypothetical protein
MNLSGWHIHWLVVYFALSIILGFGFKGVFKVEIKKRGMVLFLTIGHGQTDQ